MLPSGPGRGVPGQWWLRLGRSRAAQVLDGQAWPAAQGGRQGPGGCSVLGAPLEPSSWAPFVHPTWATPVPGVRVGVRACLCWAGTPDGNLGWGGLCSVPGGGARGGRGRPLWTERALFPRLLRELGSALTKSHLCPENVPRACQSRPLSFPGGLASWHLPRPPPASGRGLSPASLAGLPSPPGCSTLTCCRPA